MATRKEIFKQVRLVCANPQVTGNLFRTWFAIYDRLGKTSIEAWPSYETIGRDSCCSTRDAIRRVKRLVELGALIKVRKKGRDGDMSNRYTVTEPSSWCASENDNGTITRMTGQPLEDDNGTIRVMTGQPSELVQVTRPENAIRAESSDRKNATRPESSTQQGATSVLDAPDLSSYEQNGSNRQSVSASQKPSEQQELFLCLRRRLGDSVPETEQATDLSTQVREWCEARLSGVGIRSPSEVAHDLASVINNSQSNWDFWKQIAEYTIRCFEAKNGQTLGFGWLFRVSRDGELNLQDLICSSKWQRKHKPLKALSDLTPKPLPVPTPRTPEPESPSAEALVAAMKRDRAQRGIDRRGPATDRASNIEAINGMDLLHNAGASRKVGSVGGW